MSANNDRLAELAGEWLRMRGNVWLNVELGKSVPYDHDIEDLVDLLRRAEIIGQLKELDFVASLFPADYRIEQWVRDRVAALKKETDRGRD